MSDLNFLLKQHTELGTLMGKLARTSVEVHQVLVPANALQSRLHKFGQNLVRYTNDNDYEIQLIGSATGLVYRDVSFLLCTAHQVKDIPEEDIGVILQAESRYISSAGFLRFRDTDVPRQSDAEDLCAFDFTEQANADQQLSQRFFRVRPMDFLSDEDRVVVYLAYGCAFDDQRYNVSDEKHLGTVIRSMACEPQDQPTDPALGVCRLYSQMDFDPNGLSGGPVFATVLQDQEIVLKFAGIINRSGNGLIHFIKAKAVRNLLDLSFNQDA